LMAEVPNQISPDAKRNGSVWEFKSMSSANNISNAVQQHIRDAKDQSGNILLRIDQQANPKDVANGIKNADYHDKQNKIKTIELLLPDGTSVIVSKEEASNKNIIIERLKK